MDNTQPSLPLDSVGWETGRACGLYSFYIQKKMITYLQSQNNNCLTTYICVLS